LPVTPELRARLNRVRRALRFPLAGGSFLLLLLFIAWIRPMLLIGGNPDVQEATVRFEQDLAVYRTNPIDFTALPTLRDSVAALEDRGFLDRGRWSFPVMPSSVLRALWKDARGAHEGASGIEMQLAKLLIRKEASTDLHGKIVEAILARWIRSTGVTTEELAGLYLRLESSRLLGLSDDLTGGLEKLSLALFGVTPGKLDRDGQLLLCASTRGRTWIRSHPTVSLARAHAAREWLVAQHRWDTSTPSWLDDLDPQELTRTFALLKSAPESLASGLSADLDVVASVAAFEQTMEGLEAPFAAPGAVHNVITVIGPDGLVLGRSGPEVITMHVPIGSLAKLELLDVAVQAYGGPAIPDFSLSPVKCLRWFWNPKQPGRKNAGLWCPQDVAPPTGPTSLDMAVALSQNTTTAAHGVVEPYRLWRDQPALFAEILSNLRPGEARQLDSLADRGLAAHQLELIGVPMPASDVPAELSYSSVEIAFLRFLNARREAAGMNVRGLPEDITQYVGNSGSAAVGDIATYVHRKLFAVTEGCTLSDTGALLAIHRAQGTLRYLASQFPHLIYAGKTGSSPDNHGVVAAAGFCLEGRPIVVVAGARFDKGEFPKGFHGSEMLRGIAAWMKNMQKLQRHIESPDMPDWYAPEAPAVTRPEDPAKPKEASLAADSPKPENNLLVNVTGGPRP